MYPNLPTFGEHPLFKLGRGEIFVANFIPPDGASLGSYLSKNGCFWAKTGKMGLIKTALAPKPANFF